MVGSLIAGKNNLKVGDTIEVKGTKESKKLIIKGIINSGGDDDETIKETYFGKSYRTGYMCQATNGGMQL